MDKETFRSIRTGADLSQSQIADLLCYNEASGKKTVAAIEKGKSWVTGPVEIIMHLIAAGYLDEVRAASEKVWEGSK